MPIILPVGTVFFVIKFYIDFSHRVKYGDPYSSGQPRHNNYTVRSSLVKYLLGCCMLYLLINSLIFTASNSSKVPSYISFAAFGISAVACVFYWRKWQAEKENRFKRPGSALMSRGDIEPRHIEENYMHPLEQRYPAP
jgi:hypothetical protein